MQSFLDSVIANIPGDGNREGSPRTAAAFSSTNSAEEFLGISRREMIGRTVYDFLPEADAAIINGA